MNRQGLASRGMTLISSATPTIGKQRALLLHVSQSMFLNGCWSSATQRHR
jgi:hypothetical protein